LKRIVICCLIFCFMLSFCSPVYSAVWRGHAEKTDTAPDKQEIFTGETAKVEEKEVIKMVVSQVLSTGVTMEGDEFFAEVTSDVEGNGGVLLPVGTVAHGYVRNIVDPKRGGRDGWIELSFDSLITPDGREIPVKATMTTKDTPSKAVAKRVGVSTGYTVTGSVVGGMTMLNLFGIEAAIASHGYTVLGGMAAGAVMGLAISLIRKGNNVLISRGDEIKVTLQTNVELPVMNKEALKPKETFYEGLNVKIDDIWLVKDPFGIRNTFQITLDIENNSDQNFSTFTIAVVNDLHRKYFPSLFYKDSMSFKDMKKGSHVKGRLYFSVDDPKRPHWLVFYSKTTRKPLARISLDNAKKELKINFDRKRKKIKNKKN